LLIAYILAFSGTEKKLNQGSIEPNIFAWTPIYSFGRCFAMAAFSILPALLYDVLKIISMKAPNRYAMFA